eukprot:scaffold178373_cov19-Tisochrysis_lutea.AAC.1
MPAHTCCAAVNVAMHLHTPSACKWGTDLMEHAVIECAPSRTTVQLSCCYAPTAAVMHVLSSTALD